MSAADAAWSAKYGRVWVDEGDWPDVVTEKPKPSEIPYLHVRETEGQIFAFAVEIRGNRKALLRLRKQIDRALEGIDAFPLDDTLYRELDGDEYEVVVERAKSAEEMRPPVPKVEKAPERLPWAERARKTNEGG